MSSAYDPRITAYFGDEVLRAGFMPTPHLFLRHYAQLGLGHGEAMFVLQLMEINWDLAAPPKTVNEIAQRMGVNARTVRRYSEAVADLGLVTLYDQYDDSGAQIENGYDLSPLFARLAAFAPEPPLGGQARRRERRTPAVTSAQQGATYAESSTRSKQARDKSVIPGPDKFDSPSPDKSVTPPPDIRDKGRSDESIMGPLIDSSGLKKEKRIPQEQNIMMHDALSSARANVLKTAQTTPGWSLRHDLPLTTEDVAQTDGVLQRIGIDLPVRSRIRSSLSPAEAWTVWAYALAKRWSVPLLINAVYDKALRQARPAAIPPQYDAVGALLAQLNHDRAEQLVCLVAEHCPSTSPLPITEFLGTSPEQEIMTALEAVWDMIAEIRKAPGKACPLFPRTGSSTAPVLPHATTWAAVLERLAGQVAPREFATWLQETTWLELEPTSAFVGTSNVFARERIEAVYLDAIQQILSAVLGRSVRVQVVIATPANDASSSSISARKAL
ncbi:MAG TPA: DnaA N-terminal domain-containing protein [Herpetosiphonaceae bacterium]